MKTADLIDDHAADLTFVHVPFRMFGTRPFVAAQVQTVKCHEDNVLIRAQLETPGQGRILVVDGGGSTRVAVLGDILVGLAIKNGWAGIVLNGVIRDSAEIAQMDTLVFALGTSPVKSAKNGLGDVGVDVTIGGAQVRASDWVYGDCDGVLVSPKALT